MNSAQSICQSCLNLMDLNFVNNIVIGENNIISNYKFIHFTNDNSNLQQQQRLHKFQIHIYLSLIFKLRNLYLCQLSEIDTNNIIDLKDVLKTLLISLIENEYDLKYSVDGTYVIQLNFDHEKSSIECQSFVEMFENQTLENNRKKFKKTFDINQSRILKLFDLHSSKITEQFKLFSAENPCQFDIKIYHEPIYLAGRYKKLSRNLSQTPWFVDDNDGDENENNRKCIKSSVQEKIFAAIYEYMKFDGLKFSSSGREDVDVRMLGNGRPFMIEIINPRLISCDGNNHNIVMMIKKHVNENNDDIKVRDLQFVSRNESQKLLKQGEQEKSKIYQALCCIDRPFTDDDAEKLNSIKNLFIIQTTPIRVLHRRTLSDRQRLIHSIKVIPLNEMVENDNVEFIENNQKYLSHLFCIEIITEAGTYIKEFVHSDFGRTTPNVSSILGNSRTDIISLDVLEVKLDWPPTISDE